MDPAVIGLVCIGFGAIIGLFFGEYRSNAKFAELRDQLEKAGSSKKAKSNKTLKL